MSRSDFDFRWLIHPVEPEEFFREHWESQPLYVFRQEAGFYRELITLADVDRLVTSGDLRHPAIRLVKRGAPIPLAEYTGNLPWGSDVFERVANPDRVLQAYREGATIVLQALHRYWPPLGALCRRLEKHFTFPFQTNLYLTPPNSQGFAPHYDTHDVFVLQVAGSKHWRVYGSPFPLPHRAQPYSASRTPPGDPIAEFDLSAGDLIYLPRGYIHEALTSSSESMHITLGVLAATWVEVFAEALSACRQDPRFRRALPVGYAEQTDHSDAMRAEFRDLLEAFTQTVQPESLLERLADRFVSSRPPLLEGGLEALGELDRLGLETMVRRRDAVIFRLASEPETVSLLFHGKQVRFPSYAHPALRFIAEAADIFTPAALPGDLDDAGKLVLVRRLIREGFLTMIRDA